MNLNRVIDLVAIDLESQLRGFSSSGGDKNRNNRYRMAAFVKILEVQGIIPHLIDRGALKYAFAHFELDHKYNGTHE